MLKFKKNEERGEKDLKVIDTEDSQSSYRCILGEYPKKRTKSMAQNKY